MAQKEESTPAITKTPRQSAPELPHAVAKQYGLPHEDDHKYASADGAATPKTDALNQSAQVIDNDKTDKAVDDILTKDGDDLLATQDDHISAPAPVKKGFWRKIGRFFAAWWRNKWARWITIVILVIALAAAFIVPKSRYAILNTFGVRSSASVVVLDDTTQLPLKNVTVRLGEHTARTDSDGKVRFKDLTLGDYHLHVYRLAFATQSKDVTIGWGSNPLGEFKLDATGIQYTLSVKDYLSGKPIKGVEAENDELVAQSDVKGKIILTVEDTNQTTLAVTVTSPGYRTEQVTINAAKKVTASVTLVPAHKAVYVSDASGTYDVYSSDLDGKNKKRVLKGSGNEKADISLAVSPDGARAALVSTRDNIRDKDGFLVSTLTIIDLRNSTAAPVDRSQKIQLIDWIDNKLIYRKTLAGASASNPQRNRIVAFNYEANARVQLASANMFTFVTSIGSKVYYAPSSTDPHASLGLFKVTVDGKNRTRITDKEIWTGVRTAYNTLRLQTPDSWLAYDVPSNGLTKTSEPANINSLTFANDPSGKLSVWVDASEDTSELRLYNIAKSANTTLADRDGLTTPLRWAGSKAIIYRVATEGGIADYAVSPQGGKSHKIANVTPTYGF